MTTPLNTAAAECKLPQDRAMDLLQAHGVVSDNCVTLEDVAKAEQIRAANWLRVWGQKANQEEKPSA